MNNGKEKEKKEGGKYGIMIGSTLASAVCGLDDNMTALMVWNRIMRKFDPTILSLEVPQSEYSQKATEHGVRCEPIAADFFQKIFPEYDVRPGGYHLNRDFPELYVDRPDRLLYDKQGNLVGLLEIKCPYGKLYSEIPAKYLFQCQYHLQHVPQAQFCYFFAVKLDPNDPENDVDPKPFLVKMSRSEAYGKWMWPRLRLFSMYLMDKEEPKQELLRGEPPSVRVEREML
jgi:hypothetical protein